jgi:tetratricopeptide (TPR) repeat protein
MSERTTPLLQSGRVDPVQSFQQAAVLHGQGRLWEAEQLYETVLNGDRRHFDANYRLGLIRLQQKRFADAEMLFRRAIKIDKKSADARHHLAIALTGVGRLDEAIEHYRKALSLNPGYAEAHNNLGYALQMTDRHEEAARHYQKALVINTDYPEARTNLGNVLQALKRPEEAIEQYRRALALRPNYPEAHNNLASALAALHRHEEAITHSEKALALAPSYPEAHINLANALGALDRTDAAIAQYEKLLVIDPSNTEVRTRLGQALYLSGRPEDALAQFEEALVIKPDNVEALNSAGNALRALGRLDEATIAFEKAIASAPRNGIGYYNLAVSRRFTTADVHFAAMKKLARGTDLSSVEEQIGLHFALGKVFADLGDHQQSFRHLLQGNALKRQQIDYDEAKTLNQFEAIQTTFNAELIRSKQGLGDPSTLPVFIIGMPRSGTTLVEQILASHPKVFGAGELREFGKLTADIGGPNGSKFPEAVAAMSGAQLREFGAKYVHALRSRAAAAERVTDKMPANFLHAGLIHLTLPNARIIHTRRDPRDVALSCFSIMFSVSQYHTYDLVELGRHIRAYQTLMQHWRDVLPAGMMLEVDYEQIVGDLAGNARRIIAHCGLEWDDACLAFHKSKRPVQTASVLQVRQPIYTSSVGRWRTYQDQLKPLLEVLQES